MSLSFCAKIQITIGVFSAPFHNHPILAEKDQYVPVLPQQPPNPQLSIPLAAAHF